MFSDLPVESLLVVGLIVTVGIPLLQQAMGSVHGKGLIEVLRNPNTITVGFLVFGGGLWWCWELSHQVIEIWSLYTPERGWENTIVYETFPVWGYTILAGAILGLELGILGVYCYYKTRRRLMINDLF